MNFHRNVAILLLVGMIVYRATAQVDAGTIVMFSVTRDKAIIATDSRGVGRLNRKPVVIDDECKIMAFDNKALFALSGLRNCGDKDRVVWDAQATAKDVYRQVVNERRVAFGTLGENFIDTWERAVIQHPEVLSYCAESADPHKELFTALFFDLDSTSHVEAYVSIAKVSPKSVDGHQIEANGEPMGRGWMDVFNEYLAHQTPRSRVWHKSIDGYTSERKIQALAQLARQFDPKHVGGNIDMAILTAKGIKWVSTKKKCQVQYH